MKSEAPVLDGVAARPSAPEGLPPVSVAPVRPLAVLFTAGARLVRAPGPLVAVVVLLLCVPIQFESGGSVFGPGDMASGLLVVAAGVHVARSRRRLPARCAALFGGLVLAASVATVAAHDPAGSLVGLVRYLQLFVLVPMAVMVAMRSRRDVVLLAHAMILAALVEGAVGVWQFATGSGASYGGDLIRAVGTFGATDVIAMSVAVGFGLVIAVGFALGTQGRRRLGYCAVALVLLIPLGASLSRGSWIATATAVLVLLLAGGTRVFVLSVASIAAVLTIVVGGIGIGSEVVTDRLSSITSSVGSPDSSVNDRYDLWSTATSIWEDFPVTGVGIKAFPEFRDGHAPLSLSSGSDIEQAGIGFQRQELLSPHNQYLLVLSEQGILGLLGFGCLMGVLGVGALLALRRLSPAMRAPGFAVAGLAVWQAVQFFYSDLGGASSLLTSVALGLAGWSVFLAPRRPPVRGVPVGAGAATPDLPVVPVVEVHAPTTSAGPGGGPRRGPAGGTLAKAALVSAVVAAAGSAFGLLRDLLVAAYFGADGDTDAFLVAWTVPETLAPLLIEGAMAMIMVPAFGRAIASAQARRSSEQTSGGGSLGTDPVRELIEGTLPRFLLALGGIGLLVGVGAPWLVPVFTPGLADPALAVTCMRIVAVTVPLLGMAGYLAAALRTHERFAAPAAIYLAYNLGIIAAILAGHSSLGVLSAALGISLGAALMVAVQVPAALRVLPRLRTFSLVRRTTFFAFAALVPVGMYTLTRQAQTIVERFAGSSLVAGTISHLNYAQKVSQIPITLSFMAAAVTFPIFARSVAAGRSEDARRRMEVDMLVVGAVAMIVTVYLWVYAPSVVATLYERGEFTAADTASTAGVMRIYVLGLLGQALVNLLVRPYFTSDGALWFPAKAMAVGLAVTAALTFAFVGPFGAPGIAGANALGITITAVMLVLGARNRLSVAPGSSAYTKLAGLFLPAAMAFGAGWWFRSAVEGLPAPAEAVLGGLVTVATGAVAFFAPIGLRRLARPKIRSEVGRRP
jgi:murein biosynthesis integral membrane protein MurJ